MKRKVVLFFTAWVLLITAIVTKAAAQTTLNDKRFGPAIAEFNLTVPITYDHDKQVDLFAEKVKTLKTTSFYADILSSKNFAQEPTKLIPGNTYRVKIIPVRSGVSYEDCVEFLQARHALFAGVHGLTLAQELYKNQFPVGMETVSFSKNPLHNDTMGVSGSPQITRHHNGDWSFEFSYFTGFDDDSCILDFFEKSDKPAVLYNKYAVDLDAEPSVPRGWTVVNNKKEGRFTWDPAKVKLLRFKKQLGRWNKGTELSKQLKKYKVLNAAMLDFLLDNPGYIPDSWKEVPDSDNGEGNDLRNIYFYGTIYRDPDGHLCVRYLHYDNGEWKPDELWLTANFGSREFAAVIAKQYMGKK